MNTLLPERDRQGVDYGEKANVHDLHAEIPRDRPDSRLTIEPFSLWMLIVCGLAFFFAGFFSSRSGIDFSGASANRGPAQSAPVSQTLGTDANSASLASTAAPDVAVPGVVRVVIRNMKFDPATVEVKAGDVVEWKNDDITPHTVTSTSFDSASIDPDKSWKHTFNQPGNFPYNCTFHPDMKAVVTVK